MSKNLKRIKIDLPCLSNNLIQRIARKKKKCRGKYERKNLFGMSKYFNRASHVEFIYFELHCEK